MSIKIYASQDYVNEAISNIPKNSWDNLENKPFGEDNEGNIQTLDEKYIPESIARVSDVQEGKFSGSYNDLTDKPELFSGSWNDLTDKPFGDVDEWIEILNNPEFSGMFNSIEGDYIFVNNNTYKIIFNDQEYISTCFLIDDTKLGLGARINPETGEFVSDEISDPYPFGFLIDNSSGSTALLITRDGNLPSNLIIYELKRNIKQIDEKYLPEVNMDMDTIELTSVVLKSPNGTRFTIAIGNDGVLTATQIVDSYSS